MSASSFPVSGLVVAMTADIASIDFTKPSMSFASNTPLRVSIEMNWTCTAIMAIAVELMALAAAASASWVKAFICLSKSSGVTRISPTESRNPSMKAGGAH